MFAKQVHCQLCRYKKDLLMHLGLQSESSMWSNIIAKLKSIDVEKRAFGLAGIDIEAPRNGKVLKEPTKYFVLLVGTILFQISMCSYAVKFHKDIDKVAESLMIIVPTCLSLSKSFGFLAYRNEFIKLINDLKDMVKEANAAEKEKWRKENAQHRLFAATYFVCCIIATTTILVRPLPFMVHHFLHTGTLNVVMPVNSLFPYDERQWGFFLLSYMCFALLVFLNLSFAMGVDSLFSWYVHNVSAQFRITVLKYERVAMQMMKRDLEFAEFKREIVKAHTHYQSTIMMARQFAEFFRPVIFVEISLSSMEVCFYTYQLFHETQMINLPFIGITLITLFVQLMIYCFGGEKIENEGDMVSDAIYVAFPWERVTPRMKGFLMLPLMRRPGATCLDGYFFVLNRRLLVWIVKTASSFNALLLAIKEK